MNTQSGTLPGAVPLPFRLSLLSVAQRVFWWGKPEEWLDDTFRLAAQVMTYGDWEDVRTTLKALGEKAFLDVLNRPPPGVFDEKSWTFWHLYFRLPVPPMPVREL